MCAYICICTPCSLDLVWFITYSFHVKGLTEGLLLYPGRSCVERITDVIPRGTELELQLRRGVGEALYTCNNIHIKCTGVYWAQAEKYCYK